MATNVMQAAALSARASTHLWSAKGPDAAHGFSSGETSSKLTGGRLFIARRGYRQSASRPLTARQLAVRSHTEVATEVDRSTCPPVKEAVELAAFEAMDIRVGVITDASTLLDREQTERRGKPTPSRKFLQLKVDIGCETRTVVSECRYVMDVEDAVGKKVLLVANLPPVEVEGVQSHGVILTGLNYDPTPMPRSFKLILPGMGRLPPGSQLIAAATPR